MKTIRVAIDDALFERVARTAKAKCMPVPFYIEVLLRWNATPDDREITQLKTRIRELEMEKAR